MDAKQVTLIQQRPRRRRDGREGAHIILPLVELLDGARRPLAPFEGTKVLGRFVSVAQGIGIGVLAGSGAGTAFDVFGFGIGARALFPDSEIRSGAHRPQPQTHRGARDARRRRPRARGEIVKVVLVEVYAGHYYLEP